MVKKFSMELAGRTLTVEVGRVAAQANGARYAATETPLSSRQLRLPINRETELISSR